MDPKGQRKSSAQEELENQNGDLEWEKKNLVYKWMDQP